MNSIKKYLVILAISLINLPVTLINKYPVLYSDTSTYISSGFELEAPSDRPITYGILLRLFSLNGLSFLFVPIFHSLILTLVLYLVLKTFLGKEKVTWRLFLLTICLSVFTGFNWSVNQLLPDFFTSLGLLTLICLFLQERSKLKEGMLFALFFIAAASHISNVFVYLLALGLIFLIRNQFVNYISQRVLKVKLIVSLALLGISYLIMTSAISKSKHIFFAGNLAQKGILQEVLRDNCDTAEFKLCPYKDSIPESFEYFVWKESSPLYKIGGWKAARQELKTLSGISFTKPKYISMHIKGTWNNFREQLVTFGVAEGNGVFDESTLLIKRIKKYSKDDVFCVSSLQSENAFLELPGINFYLKIVTLLSVLVLGVLYLAFYRLIDKKVKLLVLLTLFVFVTSALLVSFSSEVSNRYGCKLMWLITLINFLLLTKIFEKKKLRVNELKMHKAISRSA